MQIEDHMCSGESCMPTEIYFRVWSEPSQVVFRGIADEEGGIGKVILFRDALEDGVRKPMVKGANCGWIAFEGPVSECVDLVDRNLHTVLCVGNFQRLGVQKWLLQESFVPHSRIRISWESISI